MLNLNLIDNQVLDDNSSELMLEMVKNIHALTGYDTRDIKSILESYALCLAEDVADKAMSSDSLPKSLSIGLPSIGVLRISPLFEGRTSDSVQYVLNPYKTFHNDIVSAYYYGKTRLDDITVSHATDKLTTQYHNVVQKEVYDNE